MNELKETLKHFPTPVVKKRDVNQQVLQKVLALGLDPLAASLFAARDVPVLDDFKVWFEASLKPLDSPQSMADIDKATERLAQALEKGECIGIETDHDCDGQTSHAVLYLALTEFFKHPPSKVRSYIGHRLQEGYGLSDPLVDRILADENRPTLMLTADNGSSDEPRIARLKEAGIDVIVTDHHAIPEEGIPQSAYAVLNPTRDDCQFPDRSIAGCMVAWLWMAWTRSKLLARKTQWQSIDSLNALLDFVAVGTVADCVSLAKSLNNRLVVRYGMQLISKFQRPCWRAVRDVVTSHITSTDIGFKIAPLLNSDGRLSCAFGSVSFLLSEEDQESLKWVRQLMETNQTRKDIQKKITDQAMMQGLEVCNEETYSLCLFLEEGHPGVHGITASRIRETFGRPTFIFSPKMGEPDILSGSGRSTETCHLRNALQWIADKTEGVLQKFGGHQGAAGVTIFKKDLEAFQVAFEKAVRAQLKDVPKPIILTDGILPWDYFNVSKYKALMMQLEPFGRAFETPLFEVQGQVLDMKWMGSSQTHLRFTLKVADKFLPCVWFHAKLDEMDPDPISPLDKVEVVYSVEIDEFRQVESLKCFVRHLVVLRS